MVKQTHKWYPSTFHHVYSFHCTNVLPCGCTAVLQSKILKHAGDTLAAAHQSETARRFDLSDRYLNSAAVKALMRADKPEAVREGRKQGLGFGPPSRRLLYAGCQAGRGV